MQHDTYIVPTRPRSIAAAARELDWELSGGEGDTDWDHSRDKMDRAEAELKRVAVEVRKAPALIANADRRLQRCLDEDRRRERERTAQTRRRQRRLRRDVREEKRRRERAEQREVSDVG